MTSITRDVQAEIKLAIEANQVILFMKGSPARPQCGFSAAAVKMLAEAGSTDYAYVNVLDDAEIREAIKAYSTWPTIPQLYVNQQFVGGADIIRELQASGEFARLLEK